MSDTAFVLIVEEEPDYAEQLAGELREAGYAPHVVHSREDALESIRSRPPDVIVTDARLAGTRNGLELVKESHRLAPDAEIIVMSDAAEGSLVPRRAPAGLRIYDFLAKPVNVADFRKLVTDAADRARRNREKRVLDERARRRVEFEGI